MNPEKMSSLFRDRFPEYVKKTLMAKCKLQDVTCQVEVANEIEARLVEMCAHHSARIQWDMAVIAKNYSTTKESSENHFVWYLADLLAINIIKVAVFEQRPDGIEPTDLDLGLYSYPHISESRN